MDSHNTQEQDYIIDHVGADNWAMVESEFTGQSTTEILATLNEMFPTEDNADLAERIHEELR